jgi:hypothetical protein
MSKTPDGRHLIGKQGQPGASTSQIRADRAPASAAKRIKIGLSWRVTSA